MGKKRRLMADFETTAIKIDENSSKSISEQLQGKETRVWAWGFVSIDNTEYFKYGDNIKDFINLISCYKSPTDIYIHNLKFDGEFIIDYLLRNGYRFIDEGNQDIKRELYLNDFTAIRNSNNEVYSIKICTMYQTDDNGELRKKVEVRFLDSYKIIPLKVEEMPKAFGLDIEKLEIEYHEGENQDYSLTEENINYLRNDCIIPAKSLKIFLDRGYTKMTIGSNAMYDYKKTIGRHNFDYMFPSLDIIDNRTGLSIDAYCRESYKGGVVQVNNKFRGKTVENARSFDINSLYPYCARNCLMPCLEPEYYVGEYKDDPEYPLWIGRIKFMFSVKENHVPTIQLKKGGFRGNNEVEFLENSKVNGHWDFVILTVTNVDWELIKEQYNVYNVEFIDGYKFKGSNKLFTTYVDKWNAEKMSCKEIGDKGGYKLAKLFMNAFTGKFGTKPYWQNMKPKLDEDGIVKWNLGEEFFHGSVYVPVSSFITAYGRAKLIRILQANYDNWLYCDTDSIKVLGDELKGEVEISPTKLGAWKDEGKILRARYLRVKAYIEEKVDESTGEITNKVVCSSMPKRLHDQVTFENFEIGACYKGKLVPYTIKGGRVLVDRSFELKD